MKIHATLLLSSGLALLLAGCGEAIDVASPSDPTTSTSAPGNDDIRSTTTLPETPTETAGTQSDDSADDTVPTTIVTTTTIASEPASNGEVPAAYVNAVLEHAAEIAGVEVGALVIVEAAAYDWPDGSLGCPEPDQVYTQAVTPGYQVVIGHGSDRYDYRISESGYFRLCEGRGLTPPDA